MGREVIMLHGTVMSIGSNKSLVRIDERTSKSVGNKSCWTYGKRIPGFPEVLKRLQDPQ